MRNLRNYLLFSVFLLMFSSIAFTQNVVDISAGKLSYEEKMEMGKAYIDETFPDCDIDYFAPNCVFTASVKNSEALLKDDWVEEYPHEYKLYLYYLKLENESSLSPKEKKEKERQDKLEKSEKEKQLEM